MKKAKKNNSEPDLKNQINDMIEAWEQDWLWTFERRLDKAPKEALAEIFCNFVESAAMHLKGRPDATARD